MTNVVVVFVVVVVIVVASIIVVFVVVVVVVVVVFIIVLFVVVVFVVVVVVVVVFVVVVATLHVSNAASLQSDIVDVTSAQPSPQPLQPSARKFARMRSLFTHQMILLYSTTCSDIL